MAARTLKSSRRRRPRRPAAVAPPQPSVVIVDGIEGDVARIERPDSTTVDCPLSQLPPGVQEGDVVRLVGPVGMIDPEATRERRQRAQQALDTLNVDAPTGDLDL